MNNPPPIPKATIETPSAFYNVFLFKVPDFDARAFRFENVSAAQFHISSPQLRQLATEIRKETLAHVDAEIAQRVLAEPGADAKRGINLRAAATEVEAPDRVLNFQSTDFHDCRQVARNRYRQQSSPSHCRSSDANCRPPPADQ